MKLTAIIRGLLRQGDTNVAKAVNVDGRGEVTTDVQRQSGEVLPSREAMSVVNLGDPEALLQLDGEEPQLNETPPIYEEHRLEQ